MTTTPHTLRLGAATITILNAGDMLVNMAEEMNLPANFQSSYTDLLQPAPFPSQSIHIALQDASILVDINDYAHAVPPDSPFAIPGYQPPPSIVEQLQSLNIQPEDITYVIITHAHFDHYSGTTFEEAGRRVPRFPNATYYLGKADWEHPDIQQGILESGSLEGQTLGVLHNLGRLKPVEGDLNLLPGVQIIAAPGESPGHQLVRVHSQGQTLYCVGDLFHHPIEIEHPSLMAQWADPQTNLNSRQKFIKAAIAENAIIVAAHMTPGRISGTPTSPHYEPLEW
ncbi:MAG TPA: MBL fold metallo-hydrolase [Ktedonobacteraceae bacterium]|jgi:glyoxylase-like metal-dependent hydrolase (beta-lactamase superfamily II)|nr:MBL fold metallo-hydrolase [Ktedonobacteraceae bacterium]